MDALLARIDAEMAAGRAWRAKEILRGRLARDWPPAEVVERYGQLLLATADHLEAGKYLFLSGARAAEYEPAIDTFLSRHGRQGPGQILSRLPKAVRRVPFADLPVAVRQELEARGVSAATFALKPRPAGGRWRWPDSLALAFGLVLVICVVVGGFVIAAAIVGWIRQAVA
jgi:hypothetical protein